VFFLTFFPFTGYVTNYISFDLGWVRLHE